MTRIACWGADGSFPFFRAYGRGDCGQGRWEWNAETTGEAISRGLERNRGRGGYGHTGLGNRIAWTHLEGCLRHAWTGEAGARGYALSDQAHARGHGALRPKGRLPAGRRGRLSRLDGRGRRFNTGLRSSRNRKGRRDSIPVCVVHWKALYPVGERGIQSREGEGPRTRIRVYDTGKNIFNIFSWPSGFCPHGCQM